MVRKPRFAGAYRTHEMHELGGRLDGPFAIRRRQKGLSAYILYASVDC